MDSITKKELLGELHHLLANDERTDAFISSQTGVARSTLRSLRKSPSDRTHESTMRKLADFYGVAPGAPTLTQAAAMIQALLDSAPADARSSMLAQLVKSAVDFLQGEQPADAIDTENVALAKLEPSQKVVVLGALGDGYSSE